MSAVVEDQLMADGRWSVDMDWSDTLHADLVDDQGRLLKWLHAYVYDADDNLICPPLVVLAKEGDKEAGITIGGAGLSWWLGSGSVGPLIEDREYLSGQSKLSNGGFEYQGDPFHDWTHPEPTLWIPVVGASHTGAIAAYVSGLATDYDDSLVSSERFEVEPGQQFSLRLWVRRLNPGAGRIRCRAVCTGSYHPPNILTDGGFEVGGAWVQGPTDHPEDAVIETNPVFAHSGDNHLRIQTTPHAPGANGGFEAGTLAGWTDVTGGVWGIDAGQHFTGSYAAYAGLGSDGKHLLSKAPVEVEPGQVWRVQGALKAGTGSDAPNDISARCRLTVRFRDEANALLPGVVIAKDIGAEATDWIIGQDDFTVPEDAAWMVASAEIEGRTTGRFYVDAIETVRLRGNKATMIHTTFAVTPNRTYTVTAKIRSDGDAMEGQVWPVFPCTGPIPAVLEGTRQGVNDEWVQYETSVTPPSGTNIMGLTWTGMDIYGGAFHIDDVDVRDSDGTTVVFDALSDVTTGGIWVPVVNDIVVPAGAKHLHMEIVAEALANGFLADDAEVIRTGVTIATSTAVVESLLEDADTGAPLPVLPGTILGPDPILRDWRVRNLHNRDALEHFSRVVSLPPREWKINTDRTLDWGAASQIFLDHVPGTDDEIVLLSGDIDVDDLDPVVEDTSDRATRIKLIGAEKEGSGGHVTLITASAEVAGAEVDSFSGGPVNRTLLIEDSTVEHAGHAQALVDDAAASMAESDQAITVTLKGLRTRPPFGVGDWLYLYKPDAGLIDSAYFAFPAMVEGEEVYPVRKRVLGRTRKLGPSHRIEIRRLDGTTFPLTGVRWEPEDSTQLELGEHRYEFERDPQGGDVARQYLRFRASSPR